jgi:hypothetical protein
VSECDLVIWVQLDGAPEGLHGLVRSTLRGKRLAEVVPGRRILWRQVGGAT